MEISSVENPRKRNDDQYHGACIIIISLSHFPTFTGLCVNHKFVSEKGKQKQTQKSVAAFLQNCPCTQNS